MTDTRTYDVPPVTRALALLRYIAAGHRCRNISKASAALKINRTTLIRLLHTLEREEMIEQDGEGGGYVLGYGILELASALTGNRDIVRMSRPALARLAQRTACRRILACCREPMSSSWCAKRPRSSLCRTSARACVCQPMPPSWAG